MEELITEVKERELTLERQSARGSKRKIEQTVEQHKMQMFVKGEEKEEKPVSTYTKRLKLSNQTCKPTQPAILLPLLKAWEWNMIIWGIASKTINSRS